MCIDKIKIVDKYTVMKRKKKLISTIKLLYLSKKLIEQWFRSCKLTMDLVEIEF